MNHTPETTRTLDTDRATVRDLIRDSRGRWQLASGAGRGELELPIHGVGSDRRRIAIDWIAQWTAPLRYTKHPGNPIYGPSKSGAWDTWTNGVSIVPTADGKTYRMYYAGNKGEGIGFAEAAVADPVTWHEHLASPVLRPRSDNWEGNLINQPRVVKVTETHWRMYYTGWGFQGPGTAWALGLAESFDGGTTWQRHGEQPILDRGDASSPDGAGACVPMVLRVNGRWMMWYTAGQINDKGYQNIHLCLATSADGLRWDKHPGNPVLTDDFSDGSARSVTSRCYVRHDDGVFRMWYSFAKPDYRIHYAESLDGITWESAPSPISSPQCPGLPRPGLPSLSSLILGPSTAPAWDDQMVEYPEIQIVAGIYRLWFCGNGYGSVGYAEGTPETGVNMFVRSANNHEWTQVERGQIIEAQPSIQLRAELRSQNPALSPTLNSITITPR